MTRHAAAFSHEIENGYLALVRMSAYILRAA